MSDQAVVAGIQFPATIISRADLARLVREVELLDDDLEGQKVRGATPEQMHTPPMSRPMADCMQLNHIDIAQPQVRMKFKEDLRFLKDKAPIMHFAFAVEADPEFLQRLVTWIRQEIHPQALLTVGLQPALVGGTYLRTPNHVHDFSIRALLADKRDVIVHELEALHAR